MGFRTRKIEASGCVVLTSDTQVEAEEAKPGRGMRSTHTVRRAGLSNLPLSVSACVCPGRRCRICVIAGQPVQSRHQRPALLVSQLLDLTGDLHDLLGVPVRGSSIPSSWRERASRKRSIASEMIADLMSISSRARIVAAFNVERSRTARPDVRSPSGSRETTPGSCIRSTHTACRAGRRVGMARWH
jgi:hypothetical protein